MHGRLRLPCTAKEEEKEEKDQEKEGDGGSDHAVQASKGGRSHCRPSHSMAASVLCWLHQL